VDVENHIRLAPREPSREQRRRRLVCALDEHCLRPKRPQLPRDPERERGVEREPVEQARAVRRHEPEDVVARRRARERRADHAQVEQLAHRVELRPVGRGERKAIAPTADHQQARLHERAASRKVSSSRP
jgi:hypothetical protein